MTAQEYLIERNLWYTEDNKIEITNEALATLMGQYAHHKCLEAINNTRYAAIEIVCQDEIIDTVHAIQNIKNEDVLPNFKQC